MLVDLSGYEPLLDSTLFQHQVIVCLAYRPLDGVSRWFGSGDQSLDPFVTHTRQRERNEEDVLHFYLLPEPLKPWWASTATSVSILTYEVGVGRDLKKRFWVLRVGRRGGPHQSTRFPDYRPDAQDPPTITANHVARLLRP